MPQVGQIVPSIGVDKMAALGVKDAIEAGDKRARGYVSDQRFVDSSQNLPGTPKSERRPAACRESLPSPAPRAYHDRWRLLPPVLIFRPETQKVVEVATDLPGWSVVCSYLPAIEFGCRLGQELLLDAPGDLQFVLDALSLLGFPLRQVRFRIRASKAGERSRPAQVEGCRHSRGERRRLFRLRRATAVLPLSG